MQYKILNAFIYLSKTVEAMKHSGDNRKISNGK